MTAIWPPLDHEQVAWVPSGRPTAGLRTELFRPAVFRAAVPPLIGALDPAPSPEVAALAEDASLELTRFDATLGGEVAAFAPLLLRSEAVASSRIENLTANARSVFSAELGDERKRNATLIAANTRAMSAAIDLAEELTRASVLTMHATLMASDARHTPGALRTEQVWIGRSSASPVGAEFVAPVSERVPGLLDDCLTFARRDDLPVLVQTAVTHAQFETIHPFTDGNGRTGRSLTQAMLRSKGVTRSVTVPVSAGLLTDVDAYHRALTAYRAGELDPIVRLTAEASLRAVANARTLVDDLHDVRASWSARVTARRDSSVWRLLDLLVHQPVLDATTAASRLSLAPSNVYPLLRRLVESGVLKQKAEYKMGTIWRADQVLEALDAFATRSGRRGEATVLG
ncbi:Fic family protein [Frigoribacterium sp. CFBP 8751]|uniref:Fic family protein n=1 Tax=Frigoribacterium sp. CFBP 8751 TaxID=2775277 RepID=UPI0017854BCE|nr:Fic family protein [Frigoribacterium sp. CFBP 8751]